MTLCTWHSEAQNSLKSDQTMHCNGFTAIRTWGRAAPVLD